MKMSEKQKSLGQIIEMFLCENSTRRYFEPYLRDNPNICKIRAFRQMFI